MKIAILSDIHGNLPYLEKALKFIKNKQFVHLKSFINGITWNLTNSKHSTQ